MLQTLKKTEQQGRFGNSAPLYGFCTEKVSAYIPFIVRKGSRVLCVAGSGDHLLNAVFCGSGDVTVFDISAAALWWTELKVAAAKSLQFSEFERFLFLNDEDDASRNPIALAYETYKTLAGQISPGARSFFEDCYSEMGSSLRSSCRFNNRHEGNAIKVDNNLYLRNSDAYALLQKRLPAVRVRYVHTCVSKLPAKLRSSTFDAILLSNIADYAYETFSGDSYLETFFAEIVSPLRSRLREGGVLCAAYVYACTSSPESPHSRIDMADLRRRLMERFELPYAELSFPGVIPGAIDMVLLVSA